MLRGRSGVEVVKWRGVEGRWLVLGPLSEGIVIDNAPLKFTLPNGVPTERIDCEYVYWRIPDLNEVFHWLALLRLQGSRGKYNLAELITRLEFCFVDWLNI